MISSLISVVVSQFLCFTWFKFKYLQEAKSLSESLSWCKDWDVMMYMNLLFFLAP